jgi:hypothetical protein
MQPMDKRYQVFISSTYTDLRDERQLVMQAVLEMKHIPAGMEYFPAVDLKQFEYIKKVINLCDYYVLIIGGRYGSLTEKGISYTEREYDYAVSQKVPVIGLIHGSPGKIIADKLDLEPHLRGHSKPSKTKYKLTE